MAARSGLIRAIRASARNFRRALKDAKIPVEEIILFGSRAKGNAGPFSDIDLCVVSKRFGKNRHTEMVELFKISSMIDSLIEPMPYHPRELRNKWDSLAMEIRTHGVRI